MGAILAVISVGSAEITQNLDEALYGEGSRGCNGKKSKTVANSTIKGCKKISFAQVKLRPEKYPDGAGHYYKTLKLRHATTPALATFPALDLAALAHALSLAARPGNTPGTAAF